MSHQQSHTSRRFFRSTLRLEVLSPDKPVQEGIDLEDIAYQIEHGEWDVTVTDYSTTEVSTEDMERLYPDFFDIYGDDEFGD